ncbi:hypothetical protein AB1Y20_018322 [Prymnesium parvum]|uniref:Glutamine synthetase n=1 Tax=Prymnesium parvum TaxID=97485 RepID=A0AB34JN44_PRYPA
MKYSSVDYRRDEISRQVRQQGRLLVMLTACSRASRPFRRALSTKAAAAEVAELGAAAGCKFFQFSFIDLFGVQRSKLVPASRVREVAAGGAGFAGFAAHLDLEPTDGDLLALPDPSSFVPLPWKPEVGWLACDLVLNDAELPHGPRNVLRRTQAALKEECGVVLKTGVECEFFLLDASTPSVGDVYDTQAKPCYDAHALMRRYELISTLSEHMEAMGWGPYQADHEDANGQFEINWDFDDAMRTADRMVFFKYMARTLAEAHGLRASFMPKPFAQLTGSGCHVHLSLHDLALGSNVCGGGGTGVYGLGPKGLAFLGGVMEHAPAMTAITNPTVNSYKRLNAQTTLSGATWSPNAVTWSGNNRTSLVRVPGGAPRMELRLADMAANAYLLPAAIGAAGLTGLKGEAPLPPPPHDVNLYVPHRPEVAAVLASATKLPPNLYAALQALDKSTALRAGLGDSLVDAYLKLRGAHWQNYSSHLSQWELDNYIDC